MKSVLLLLCLLLFSGLQAQEVTWNDVVETKNGRRFEGKILAYEYDEQLVLELADGQVMIFEQKQIRKLRYASGKAPAPTAASPAEQLENEPGGITRRLRPYVALLVHGGKQNTQFFGNNQIYGYGLEGLLFYQAAPWLQLGLGGAYDVYNTNRGESVVSALSAARVVITGAKKVFPFFQLSAGYGKPVKTERLPLSDAEGGLLLHPAVGVRLGRKDQRQYSLDVGYRLLDTRYASNTFQGQEIRTNNYRRLSFRVSSTF